MCGYDPFYWYEYELDMAHRMNELGVDSLDEYWAVMEELKNDTQIQDYESREGY